MLGYRDIKGSRPKPTLPFQPGDRVRVTLNTGEQCMGVVEAQHPLFQMYSVNVGTRRQRDIKVLPAQQVASPQEELQLRGTNDK